ncbi:sigma factor-like helix-turn-helix DNA-binding protein [Mediterraneibacter gnavus]|jgi:DNA-binding CsgD family transcriptional regulator|uniref:sigma factor-like helix-turn-helix DNA-binding protein n=1 Tax=Mediterraneibacter gnavus TaxID=33038 RepID=UPI00366CE0C7
MRNIKNSTFPENILEEIGINKVSEKKIDYSELAMDQMKGLQYAVSQMKVRDSMILLCRYEDKMTYKEIGERFSITGERVQQLVTKGLRKLRHPMRYSYIVWGYDTYNQMLAEKRKQVARLKKEDIEKSGDDILQIDLAALQLSIKTWNILNRIGIHTIGELINVLEKGQEELQIRMRKRCFSEMIYSLEELGLFCESDFDKENNDIG